MNMVLSYKLFISEFRIRTSTLIALFPPNVMDQNGRPFLRTYADHPQVHDNIEMQ